jgi:hypothetical protein
MRVPVASAVTGEAWNRSQMGDVPLLGLRSPTLPTMAQWSASEDLLGSASEELLGSASEELLGSRREESLGGDSATLLGSEGGGGL